MEDPPLSTKAESLPSISSVGDTQLDTLNLKLIRKSARKKKTLSFPSFSNIAALFIKNWITMKRNILLLLFVFFLPASILLVNSLTIGLSPRNLPMALVNLESDCADESYINRCEANLLGCYFKKSLNDSDTVNLLHYTNISKAESDVRNAKIRGMVFVPENLSVSYLKRILGVKSWRWDQFLFFYDVVDGNVNTNQTVSVTLDASDPQGSVHLIPICY